MGAHLLINFFLLITRSEKNLSAQVWIRVAVERMLAVTIGNPVQPGLSDEDARLLAWLAGLKVMMYLAYLHPGKIALSEALFEMAKIVFHPDALEDVRKLLKAILRCPSTREPLVRWVAALNDLMRIGLEDPRSTEFAQTLLNIASERFFQEAMTRHLWHILRVLPLMPPLESERRPVAVLERHQLL